MGEVPDEVLRGEEPAGVIEDFCLFFCAFPMLRLAVADDSAAAFDFCAMCSISEANAFVKSAPLVPRGFLGFRCSLYFPDKKYSFNNGECTKHCSAEDMKQVFPKLFSPHAVEEKDEISFLEPDSRDCDAEVVSDPLLEGTMPS